MDTAPEQREDLLMMSQVISDVAVRHIVSSLPWRVKTLELDLNNFPMTIWFLAYGDEWVWVESFAGCIFCEGGGRGTPLSWSYIYWLMGILCVLIYIKRELVQNNWQDAVMSGVSLACHRGHTHTQTHTHTHTHTYTHTHIHTHLLK